MIASARVLSRWSPLIAIYWERPDEYESRADPCVHESEKAGKDSGCKGKTGQKIRILFYYIKKIWSLYFGKKVVLELSSGTNFVYSLNPIVIIIMTIADSHLWRPSGPYYPARPGHPRPLTVMPRKALYMSST